MKHVRAEPSLAGKSYREALTRTIVSNYCQKWMPVVADRVNYMTTELLVGNRCEWEDGLD